MLVARVAGESFADFSRKRLFEPLGMTRTSWRDDFTRLVEDRAVVGSPGHYRPIGPSLARYARIVDGPECSNL